MLWEIDRLLNWQRPFYLNPFDSQIKDDPFPLTLFSDIDKKSPFKYPILNMIVNVHAHVRNGDFIQN